ncbi:MAG: hypothetical protein KatS3mg057_2802 [Herpetosiphonaceae bacterium]|nr:MAG: hypothetical protein KatS3mg057_2802 [Herpetosiphonaceae bacterium]
MEQRRSSLPRMLRAARLARGITQQELGQRLGVTQSTISLWESGNEIPTVEHMLLLAVELPEIMAGLSGYERELLERVLRLERTLFAGRCACPGCQCEQSAGERAQ